MSTTTDTLKFSVLLRLDGPPLRHFEAIDYRRAMDLADGDSVDVVANRDSLMIDVGEDFARTWFNGYTSRVAVVDYRWLARGELQDGPQRTIKFAPMTAERGKELYVRARFEEVKAGLAELQDSPEDD